MNVKPLIVASLLAAGGLLGTGEAGRADITYLVNATFDDSTTLTGDFTLNGYGYLKSYDLRTTVGALAAETYTVANSFIGGGNLGGRTGTYFFLSPDGRAYDGGLQLSFQNTLGACGVDPIVGGAGGPSWENVSFTAGGPPVRFIEAGGFATGVPEPATWAMLLLGLAGLGVVAHSRGRLSAHGRSASATARS